MAELRHAAAAVRDREEQRPHGVLANSVALCQLVDGAFGFAGQLLHRMLHRCFDGWEAQPNSQIAAALLTRKGAPSLGFTDETRRRGPSAISRVAKVRAAKKSRRQEPS
jgi:hypothetical protein